ncbi:hypothetical protein F2P81_011462 [Scophthalmus maximus]|uniref:AB hydrolase-1 domain-containing protein n=1 Tax=Scophthalmus maximus TaxID=52904 RepID=A0A6A4SW98_SCOMX|nr:hypothetical protein F2P81_011462 [Scophthalmus maximus]
MDEKELSDPLNNVALIKDDLTRSNMGSSGDSEKILQRLNDELREAQDLANTEKHKSMELLGILEEEREENKQQADESAKQIKLLQGQLRQLHDEIGVLREQIDVSSGSRDELQSARDEVNSLKRALESATAERDRDVAAIQTNLATASKDLDKWRQTANKYEHEIENLQCDLQQQSKQWQKTAEIQAGELQSMQAECNGLQKECSVLRSERQEIVNKHQKEKSSLQSECASLRAEKEELTKTHLKEKGNLQSDCAAQRSEKEAVLQKQQQLEKELAGSRAQNAELTNSQKALERSQQELEKRLAALQLQHQQDSTKWQSQVDEADSRSSALQRECEDAKTELSDLKERYEKTEQEKQSLTDELGECKANMKDLQEKGTKYINETCKLQNLLTVNLISRITEVTCLSVTEETKWGKKSSAMAADLDVVNLFIIAGGTLAVPILAFVASFLLWPAALIKVYYWYWRRTLGLQVHYADCGGYRFCYSHRGKPGMRPSILMLHGFSAHKDTWLTLVKILQGLVDVRQPHNTFYQEVFMEIVDEKSRYALQDHLHLITAPLQVIWGKQDQVVDVSGAAVIAEALPGCRVDLLENCGHSVVMERPCRTAKLLLEFIILQQDARGGTKKAS